MCFILGLAQQRILIPNRKPYKTKAAISEFILGTGKWWCWARKKNLVAYVSSWAKILDKADNMSKWLA